MLALLALAGDLSGHLDAVDRAILEWRYRMLADRKPASLALVEIDAQSIAAVGAWPFARARSTLRRSIGRRRRAHARSRSTWISARREIPRTTPPCATRCDAPPVA